MSSIANLVYEFPHEWPNDLRLGILGNKEILRKYQISVETCLPVSSLPSRNQTLAIAVKKHAKVDIKLFLSFIVLLDFSILFQIFCPGL